MRKFILPAIITLLTSYNVIVAQTGFLRGNITDGEYAEGLIGATIAKSDDITYATKTDFDGNYSLKLPVGTHTIKFSYISYATQVVNNVVIKEGEVTTLNLTLKQDVEMIEEVVIEAEQVKNTDVALLTVQKKSVGVIDGMSAQTFQKTGDNNLGSAIKRVTGVSVQGGKYVYVRGLGDRYTKTILNGMAIPSLDPDKNAVQIDIFPTSVLQNVMVYKTFTPDLYGDFTGGIVDVETKSFPDEKTTKISMGASYIPGQHFNSEYVSYEGGSTDFLAFDDGTRKRPLKRKAFIPDNAVGGSLLESQTRSFTPIMNAERSTSFMNYNFSINHGNQINRTKATWGYNAVLNYRNQTKYYADYLSRSRYRIFPFDKSVIELDRLEEIRGDAGFNTAMWSALATGALKYTNHSITTTLLHSRSAETQAQDRLKVNVEESNRLLEDVLTYSQRSLTNCIVNGKHSFGKHSIDWRNSFTISRVYDPDFRVTSLSIFDGFPELDLGAGSKINRFFRDLNELNESFKVDYKLNLDNIKEGTYIKAGALFTTKSRSFRVDNYIFGLRSDTREVDTDVDLLFSPENIWTAQTDRGIFVQGSEQPNNIFDASQNIIGLYAMNVAKLFSNIKVTYGLRVETTQMFYTGENTLGEKFDNDKTLDVVDLLPSLNLVYTLVDDMNIRASANRTIARPTFREKSGAEILDPIEDFIYAGNIDLERTTINNYDLRWEYFFKPGQVVSVSGFFKQFDKHIETVFLPTNTKTVSYRNTAQANVYGVELEIKKNMAFLFGNTPYWKYFDLGGNVSLIRSAVDIKSLVLNEATEFEEELTEHDLRVNNAREGEEIPDTRPMAGQSPYMINGFINWKERYSNVAINISYNVQGEALTIVGSGNLPDVYTKPFNSLNLSLTRAFLKDDRLQATFRIRNILNDDRELVFKNYTAKEVFFRNWSPGRQFSFKLGYSF